MSPSLNAKLKEKQYQIQDANYTNMAMAALPLQNGVQDVCMYIF